MRHLQCIVSMNTNIKRDFQIYISVRLTAKSKNDLNLTIIILTAAQQNSVLPRPLTFTLRLFMKKWAA